MQQATCNKAAAQRRTRLNNLIWGAISVCVVLSTITVAFYKLSA